jgi:uncharacterized membrane protein
MKKNVFALFSDADKADGAINYLHNELHVPTDEISFVYKDSSGDKVSGDGGDVASTSTAEGATAGAATGGVIGAVIGLVGVAGLLGPFGPIVVAGPLATVLGITGAVGTVVGTGVAGAAVGGIVGALTTMGVSESRARKFEERVAAGEILVDVHTDDADAVVSALHKFHPTDIEVVEDNL